MANVVLVVDMIEAFCRIGRLANPRAVKIIPKIEELLQRKEKEGYALYALTDHHMRGDKEFDLFGEHAVDPREREVVPELRKYFKPENIILKTTYTGFFGTLLGKKLAQEKPKVVIVVGVCTDICVFFTTYDLARFGYNVIVPRDAVETYNAPEHDAEEINRVFLAQMKNILGVKVVDKQEEI